MKIETRTEQVKYDVFVTSDGSEFTDKTEAQHHEQLLSGDRKNVIGVMVSVGLMVGMKP